MRSRAIGFCYRSGRLLTERASREASHHLFTCC